MSFAAIMPLLLVFMFYFFIYIYSAYDAKKTKRCSRQERLSYGKA